MDYTKLVAIATICYNTAVTGRSKYFELRRQPHEFFLTGNTCLT